MNILFFIFFVHVCVGTVIQRELPEVPPGPWDHHHVIREVTLDDRYNCNDGDPQPPNRVDTSQRVADLRQEITNYGLDAYIIPSNDAHQSEYVALPDMRREYISGFSGSAGTAVVTSTEQAQWTDGRYFLQADDQLDCNWLLMKQGLEGVPSITEWLKQVLPPGSTVGADPTLLRASTWDSYADSLAEASITMEEIPTNLVDLVWTDRPEYSTDPVFVWGMEFAGQSWEDKVANVRVEMTSGGADMAVLTALDDIAWLLNLRGNDIPYNPVFRSYVLVGMSSVQLFIPTNLTDDVRLHLHVDECGTMECVEIQDYDAITGALTNLADDATVTSILVSYSSSYAIYNAVPAAKRNSGMSPVTYLKAKKNDVEIQGMRNAHVKDAVGLCVFLAFMESEMAAGNPWDELNAAYKLEEFRAQQQDFLSLSFETISSIGSNAAIIHYSPTPETTTPLDTNSVYLVDSGSQFQDGTTDVTRTMHYGTPRDVEIEAYTRVLKGQMDFASLVFPASSMTTIYDIDILARRNLYEVGWDYRHGTSHGIGACLFVHETLLPYYQLGEFMSDEPGYYEDGEFGIRLENAITVVSADTPYDFTGPSLTFETVTLVPYEPKLIDTTLLTQKQCNQLNEYHAKVLDIVGPELQNQGHSHTYDWLVTKTVPLAC